jgi:DNA repair protein RecO (recombination protein O)
MPVYKTNALVLRRIPLGEKDKIVTLYTREWGKLSAVAKGARRTTSRLSGATEPLMFVRGIMAEGMNLDVLTQSEIRESFPLLRGDFGRFLRATYCCELLDRMTEERSPDAAAFDLLLSTLYILQRATDPDVPVHAFELQLMAHAGYEPQLHACTRCESLFDEISNVADGRIRETATPCIIEGGYSAIRGGAMCIECSAAAREEVLRLKPDTAAMMRRLTTEDNARALAALELAPALSAEMNRAIRAHLRIRLERDVRSTAFLDAYRVGAMDDLSETHSTDFYSRGHQPPVSSAPSNRSGTG